MSTPSSFLFSSEVVNEGHPDKICDLVSDAILDACLKDDENASLSCETCIKNNIIMVFGEVATTAAVNYEKVVRETIKQTNAEDITKLLENKQINILIAIEEKAPIVDETEDSIIHQGTAFGYATSETATLMPLSHYLATQFSIFLTDAKKQKTIEWVRPDRKIRVTVEYTFEDGQLRPVQVQSVRIPIDIVEELTQEQMQQQILTNVVYNIETRDLLNDSTIYEFVPVEPGTNGLIGLSGRLILNDTYGGWGARGGSSLSGKDPKKIERFTSYTARWIAKSLVQANLCTRAYVQISYTIGLPYPSQLMIDTFGTGTTTCGKSDSELITLVNNNFDLRPNAVLLELKLKKPIYFKTAVFGHFGRLEKDFTWEVAKEMNMS